MIKLSNLFEELLNESEESFQIIVLIDQNFSRELTKLNEGQWKESDEKGYYLRVDKPKNCVEKLHVHIAKEKHKNTKNKQVAWNNDGTRHDRKHLITIFQE
jgi:hypothetical protein